MTSDAGARAEDCSPETTDERSQAVRAVEAEFGELVTQFRRLIQANAERVSPGLLPGSYKVFTSLVRHGPITASALAEHLVADKGQISRTVRELEDLELVARTPDPNDGRASLIEATPEGLRRLEEARTPQENRLFHTLNDWSIDDIRSLATLLHALTTGEAPQER